MKRYDAASVPNAQFVAYVPPVCPDCGAPAICEWSVRGKPAVVFACGRIDLAGEVKAECRARDPQGADRPPRPPEVKP